MDKLIEQWFSSKCYFWLIECDCPCPLPLIGSCFARSLYLVATFLYRNVWYDRSHATNWRTSWHWHLFMADDSFNNYVHVGVSLTLDPSGRSGPFQGTNSWVWPGGKWQGIHQLRGVFTFLRKLSTGKINIVMLYFIHIFQNGINIRKFCHPSSVKKIKMEPTI